jgi:DNA-binding transcriptional MerR regulator/methanogenic corrinoid protein MtbC1
LSNYSIDSIWTTADYPAMSASSEARHPIGVVAERTGLSPDVLRVWERRYGVVEPKRSQGGQRLYSDADIERLALLNRATQGGHGISHVASLGKAKLEELARAAEDGGGSSVAALTRGPGAHAAIDQAVALAKALNPAGLETLLRRSAARYGIVAFIDDIAAPFLRRVGDGWHAGQLTVAQEHFATAVVQRVVIETVPLLSGSEGSPSIIVGTLEGERHAVGALMAAAAAASEGWRVTYLGADLPVDEIVAATVASRVQAVGLSVIIREKRSRTAALLRALEKGVPAGVTILVGGSGATELKASVGRSGILFLDSVSALQAQLGAMRA